MRRTSEYGDDFNLMQDQSSMQADYEDDSDILSPPVDAADGLNDNFKVVIRVRPPVQRELEGSRPFINVVRIPNDHRSITLCEHLDTDDGRSGVYSTQTFSFDYVYDAATKQKEVYERSAQPAVSSVLQGYNATVIAYGQTGTGKTFTMEGFSSTSDDRRGIIPRAIEEIFSYIDTCKQSNMRFLVRASYLQIYNEVISDLLKPLGKQLSVRHTKQRGVYIDGLSEWVVRSPNDVYGLMERGTSLRATAWHKMSELSSRSHAMFIIIVEVMEGDEESPTSYKFGKLNIVDLAGSEKVRQTGVTGQRLEETKSINWSLHELGNVISALTTRRRDKHIPFRNSCLTSALRDSLGGNCKTTLIACISPALESYSESLSTLKFANRAKNIKNEAVVNEDVDQGTLLRRYEKELKRLRQQLQQRDGGGGGGVGGGGGGVPGGVVDYGVITQLEQGKRRAEEDREAALEALQESSRAHHEERVNRKRLEERIHELESIVSGGHAGGMLGPSGIIESGLTSEDYATRLDELDKERQVIEEDKAQVDRYKQLLLKQRDIMLNLTTRLNERDETILRLQEEIDAYDAHIQMLEDAMEANAVTVSTRTEAQEYLHRISVAPRNAMEVVRYRSEGNPDHFLTAEEKLIELLMVKGMTNTNNSNNINNSSKQHQQQQQQQQQQQPSQFSNSEEKHVLEMMLRDRVEVVAQRTAADRLQKLNRELDAMRSKLLSSEDKRRSLEYLVEMAKQQQPASAAEALTRAKRFMEQEQESLKTSYHARINALQQELDGERDQRRRFSREMDRCRFDLNQIKAFVDSSKRAEVDRLWRSIEATEEALSRDMANSPVSPSLQPASPASASGNYRDPMSPAMAAADAQKLRSLEVALEAAKKQQAQQQQEFLAQLQERDRVIQRLESEGDLLATKEKEIASLSKNLSTQLKDRRALKTIMESRIKVKVDNINELFTMLTNVTTPSSPATSERNKVSAELRALQNLVNASITAMESS